MTDAIQAKKTGIPVWVPAIVMILCLALGTALLWQPILVTLNPGLALTIAATNSLYSMTEQISSPLTDALVQAAGHIADGSMDVSLSASNLLIRTSFRLRTDSDPAAKQQSSAYIIDLLGIETDFHTYLDQNCAAFSTDLVSGGAYYGLTFDSYETDLEKAGFAAGLSPETLENFHAYVAELRSIYNNGSARQGSPELPDMDAPNWARTLLAYIMALEFEGTLAQNDRLPGDVVSTQMTGRYAAEMFLETLETLSTNVIPASTLYPDSEDSAPALQETLEYYRDHTQGTVNFTAYIQSGTLTALELNWTFTENTGTMTIPDRILLAINLGQDPGQGTWTFTLEQQTGSALVRDIYTLTAQGTLCKYGLTLIHEENGANTETAFRTRWDEASGLLTMDMTKVSGGKEYTVGTSGILERTDTGVRCAVSGLHDFIQLLTLPDFLQDLNLYLFTDVTLSAEFTSTAQIQKPGYINLDQWELPWLLELLL